MTFVCATLRCTLTREACVARQDHSTRHGGQDRRPLSHQMCDPDRCAVGAANRAAVDELRRAQADADLGGAPDTRAVAEAVLATRASLTRESTRSVASLTDELLRVVPLPTPAAPARVWVSSRKPEPKPDRVVTPEPVPPAAPAPKEPPMPLPDATCTTPGCGKPVKWKGLCRSCYQRDWYANKGKAKPAKAKSAPAAKPAPVAPPAVATYSVSSLSNPDLAALITAARAEAAKRLHGTDALRAAIQ